MLGDVGVDVEELAGVVGAVGSATAPPVVPGLWVRWWWTVARTVWPCLAWRASARVLLAEVLSGAAASVVALAAACLAAGLGVGETA